MTNSPLLASKRSSLWKGYDPFQSIISLTFEQKLVVSTIFDFYVLTSLDAIDGIIFHKSQ